MEFAFAIRQMSGVRELYECAQRMESWMPSMVEGLSATIGRGPAVEPRYLVLHDAESARLVHGVPLPVWSEPDRGLIHLCPDVDEWKGLLTEWTGGLKVPGDGLLRFERYARCWTLKFLTCVMVGQGLAKHYDPLYSLPRTGRHAWLRHGIALMVGRHLWKAAEPVLHNDAAECERLLLECCPADAPLETAFGPGLTPGELWPAYFRSAAAAGALAESVGGLPALLKALKGPFTAKRPGSGNEPYVRLFRNAGFNEEAAVEFLRRWNVAPDEAA